MNDAMQNIKKIQVTEQPQDRLYHMKLKFRASTELKEISELARTCGFSEVPVIQDALTMDLVQTVPFIPDDDAIARYADIIKETYQNSKLTITDCKFIGYEYLYMVTTEKTAPIKQAVLFDTFAAQCPYFTHDTNANNGYGCNHPEQNERSDDGQGLCYCFSCPLGHEIEPEDFTDAKIHDTIQWDGTELQDIGDGDYLAVNCTDTASPDEKAALKNYNKYLRRYEQ